MPLHNCNWLAGKQRTAFYGVKTMPLNQSMIDTTPVTQTAKEVRQSISRGCFALIWVRGISEQHESALLRDTTEIEGVLSARFSRREPYILMVSYDPMVTNSTEILKEVASPELTARIVGC
jgi:hypothetical protein